MDLATPRNADLTLDADHNEGLVARYRRMEDLLGGGEPPGLAVHELKDQSSNNKVDTYHRALRGRLLVKSLG